MISNFPRNTAIGPLELRAWSPYQCVVWVQTRDSKHAARLASRSDSKLVVIGMTPGHYLKTFAFEGKTMGWAERLIARYTSPKPSTGMGVNEVE